MNNTTRANPSAALASLVAGLALVAATLGSARAAEYGYSIEDPYLATVIGTALADQAEVPLAVPERIRRFVRFRDREIPRAFVNRDAFAYTVSAQRGEAPLIFVVAGTGANHRSQNMRFLQRVFFAAGYHVVLLSSPTAPDFILTASADSMPGWMAADVADLYEVMKRVREDLATRLEISRFYLTGYSLGGSQSAFLGALDRQEEVFDFERILLINPSVSLFTSVGILDGLFEVGLPDGATSAETILARLFAEIARFTREQRGVQLDSELLYHIAEQRIAEGRPPKRQALQALIAAAFRISSANLVFTSDAMHGGGHVVERGRELGITASLTVPFKRSVRWPFERYLDDLLVPYWSGEQASLDRDTLIKAGDLASIRDFLADAPHVGVMTNADDIILTPADVDFLRETFGDRATIFPRGGHCGNMRHRENVAAMLQFFERSRP